MSFSIALQLALVLACVPAITLTVLAAQIAPLAQVDSTLSSAPISHAQKPIPGNDVSVVIVAASDPGHKEHSASSGTKPAPSKGLISGKGVVLKVDRANATVKIDHDPIPALDWPKMTMPFSLTESALADQVKEGDTVEFFMEKSGSDYVIVKFRKQAPTKRSH